MVVALHPESVIRKMRKLLFILAIGSLAANAKAQNGVLTGKIQSSNGRTVAGVKIFATGQTDTSYSDIEGKYRLTLPSGKHEVTFNSKDFQEFTDSTLIETDKETWLNVELANIEQIKEIGIKVAGKKKAATVAGAIQAKQLSTNMVEAISAEDFKRTTIKTTGDAIKRIPGATIMEGKFANIRGMFDRYNAGYLNGAPLPSTESDRKAFSFDIIPASLLDNIVVIKSGTPDLIGDFGGGIIRINTKSIPEKLTQTLNIGFQYNSITTFKPIETFSSSPSEFLGIPGANRNIPLLQGKLNQNKPEVNGPESQKFNNDWSMKTTTPMPAPRFSYSLGVPFKLKNNREIGLLVSLNYSLTQKYSDGYVTSNDYSDNHLRSAYNDRLYTFNVQNGGIANLSFKINNRNRIDWKNLYTINYDASSTQRKGTADFDDQKKADGYSNLINYNRLMSTQLNGTHLVGKKQTTITWLVNHGNTNREIPDFRIANYGYVDGGERSLVLNDFFNAGSGRFFSSLQEKTLSVAADVQHSFETGKMSHSLKYGIFTQDRNRTFKSREFVYGPVDKIITSNNKPDVDLSADKIGSNGIYLIEKTNAALDEYDGKSSLKAAFAMLEHHYPLFKSGNKPYLLKVIYGARIEQFTQTLTNNYFNIIGKELSNTGTKTDLLPSINIIAPASPKTGFRMAYYKTVNRPEMRELAPFAFYNFNLNSEILGNQKLQRAELHNFDFRYEIFPGKEDMFSIGAFAKNIINPIEFALETSQQLIRTFYYKNEKSAKIAGVELELRKNLGFMGKYFGYNVFKNLNLYANVAVIQSRVQFNDENTGIQNRPLQGQSPYVTNISLFYENKNGLSLNANFNKMGNRIAYIGVPKNVQPFGMDIYEFGRGILDFQIGKTLGKAGNIRLTFGDLLAQKTVFFQDVDGNKKYEAAKDNTLFSFTNGRTVSISYGYTF